MVLAELGDGDVALDSAPRSTHLCQRDSTGGLRELVRAEGVEKTLRAVPSGTREIDLAKLHAPAVVGELELFTGRPGNASVRALSDARLLAIPHDRVRARIADGDPAVLKVMLAIAKTVAARLVAVTEKFIEIETASNTPRADELRAFRTKLFSEWS